MKRLERRRYHDDISLPECGPLFTPLKRDRSSRKLACRPLTRGAGFLKESHRASVAGKGTPRLLPLSLLDFRFAWMALKKKKKAYSRRVCRWEVNVEGESVQAVATMEAEGYHNVTAELAARQLLGVVEGHLGKREVSLLSARKPNANLAAFQVDIPLGGEVDVTFSAGSNGGLKQGDDFVSQLIQMKRRAFDEQVRRAIPMHGVSAHLERHKAELLRRVSVASLVGGIGFFRGSSLVRNGPSSGAIECQTEEVYTCSPSRTKFPRGFLWDEGFHQLLLLRFDERLSMLSLGHWLDLERTNGWIPREQILGDEARSRVPPEFLVQDSQHANPPSLFLALEHHATNELSMPRPASEYSAFHVKTRRNGS